MGPEGSVGSEGSAASEGSALYAGWVYHVGVNSLGYPFCHARFLVIKGKFVTMYKHNPQEHPRSLPIRTGVAGQHLMVEEVGRQIHHGRALYVLRIYSRMDHSRQGEFACDSAEEVEKWIAAFHHAKEEAELDLERASSRRLISNDDEFKLNGRRPYGRSYARGLTKLITIGRGPAPTLLRRASVVTPHGSDTDNVFNQREGDTVEQADWRCFCTVNGLRIFEDIAASKAEKGTIMKAVGVVEASPDTVFEMIMSLETSLRFQWDVLTADLELVEQLDGHTDIVYGTFDPKFFKRWHSKRDFVFSRYWRRDQDGSYSITQISTTHKSKKNQEGFQRIEFNPGIWEISPLPPRAGTKTPRSLVTQIMEVKSTGWGRWKSSHYSKFHETVPFVMLCRIAGLREFFEAKPELTTVVEREVISKEERKPADCQDVLSNPIVQVPETSEEFYDAIMGAEPADDIENGDEVDDEEKSPKKGSSQRFRTITWSVMMGLRSSKRSQARESLELNLQAAAVQIDSNLFKGSLRQGIQEKDFNCWSEPSGKGFMVRSRTYTEDNLKVPGSDPLLKLLAVDWVKSVDKFQAVRLPGSIVQTKEGKKAPFILVVNLQVPAKQYFSLVLYFVANKPIRKGSLLDQFANGDDAFRNARFKLIPSIAEGYWMVKRAVGTKACLLGKAVTCHYLREDNFLEIDVDIGSSSVARGVCGLVLGYVTTLIVDLAILIEAKDEAELPEYILGTLRLNRIRVESAVTLPGDP